MILEVCCVNLKNNLLLLLLLFSCFLFLLSSYEITILTPLPHLSSLSLPPSSAQVTECVRGTAFKSTTGVDLGPTTTYLFSSLPPLFLFTSSDLHLSLFSFPSPPTQNPPSLAPLSLLLQTVFLELAPLRRTIVLGG